MAARSIEVAVEERLLLQCVADNFFPRVLAGSQIKVSRLTHCHHIFLREKILTPAFVKKTFFFLLQAHRGTYINLYSFKRSVK